MSARTEVRGAASVVTLDWPEQRLVGTPLAVPLPTIAAVDGAAVGLGMDLALACDLRLCGPAGWMRQGWAKLGLLPGTGGVALLQRLAPAALWEVLSTDPTLDGSALDHRVGLLRSPEFARRAEELLGG